jgi:hypothetical protein
MNRRVFVGCVVAFGWVPIALGYSQYVVHGSFTPGEWAPVMLMQLLVLALGATGGALAGYLVSQNEPGSSLTIDSIVCALAPALGMIISMVGVFGGAQWVSGYFPAGAHEFINGFMLFGTGVIGYAAMVPALYYARFVGRRQPVTPA